MRSILLVIEEQQVNIDWGLTIGSQDFEKYYAATKLFEAHFVKADYLPGTDSSEEYIVLKEITFTGHQFLEGIRDDNAWKFIKDGAKGIGNFSIQVLAEFAKVYLAARLRAAIS